MINNEITNINEQLNILEETKSQIKQAIINKGQSISDNNSFRDYVDKITNISTEPSRPLGIKVYKSVEILDDQSDLIDYYVTGAQSGEFMNLNSYQFRFTAMNSDIQLPQTTMFQVIYTNPALINGEVYTYANHTGRKALYYFSPEYTQVYIQVVSSLGVYDNYVASFLNAHNITEAQLLQLDGWYDGDIIATNHPVIEHTNLHWAVRLTVQDFLLNTYEINNVLDFIDIDTTNINMRIVSEDNVDDAISAVEDINGGFISNSDITDTDFATSRSAYTNGGLLRGRLLEFKDGSASGNIAISDNFTIVYRQNDDTVMLSTLKPREGIWRNTYSDTEYIDADYFRQGLGITASIIKEGVTICGVTGTYVTPIKTYTSETAMNNDIANITEGEVVKVVENNITTFYLKETTMKKLVKEEDVI